MGGYCMGINRMELDQKLPRDDERWYNFNQSFDNLQVDAVDLAAAILAGRAYTSWHNPQHRCSDNWQLSQFIAIDMDTGDRRSAFDTVCNNDWVCGYGTLIHTTPSHTTEKPRCRVVFLLDRPILKPDGYNKASKFLSLCMGGDPVATDPSRFFYGNLNGQVEMLGGKLSVDFLLDRYRRFERLQQQQGDTKRPKLTSQRFRNQELYTRIQEALDRIDPWSMPYKDWCAIISAVKFELGDDGFDLASAWAQGKKNEVERMWRSFRREGGNVAALGTIIHWAYEV